MQLNSTRYQNNTRVVIGTPIIYQDDVVLLCDTSVGPVTINLLGIPYNYWNTQWALYIIDKSGNAGTNNITINAGTTLDPNTGLPVAQLINGASSQVINVNGGYGKITIGANTLYNATFSFGGGGITSAYQLIQDEGVSVLPQRTILNFVGAGVTATDDGVSKTIVTIPGGGGGASIVYLLNSALLTLISTNAVVPGQLYMVTNPNYAINGVLLVGTSTNSVSLEGSGGFLNADYQKVGNYSGVPTFVSNLGIWWNAIGGVVLGSVVIWNNIHYLNITGVNTGVEPSTDTTNWTPLTASITNGYILEWDFVKYNPTSNNVIYRADKRNNEVDRFVNVKAQDTLLMFQWGRNKTTRNKISGESVYDATNDNCIILANYILNGTFSAKTPNQEPGTIAYNSILNLAQLDINTCRGTFQSNFIEGGSTGIGIGLLDYQCQFFDNVITGGAVFNANIINGNSAIFTNNLESHAVVNFGTFQDGQFIENYVANYGNINASVVGPSAGGFNGCRVTGNNIMVTYLNPLINIINGRTASIGYSNFEGDLDFNDIAVWDNATGKLTIPLYMKSYVGFYRTLNSAFTTNLSKIANSPILFPFKLFPSDTTSLSIAPVLISLAGLDDVIATTATGSLVLTGRTSGSDSADFERLGNVNGLKLQVIYL